MSDTLKKKIQGLRDIVWEEDVPSLTCPEYIEHHKSILKILKYIDNELLPFANDMQKEEMIQQYMKESVKYGFKIVRKDGRYYCTTTCQRCGKVFTHVVAIHFIENKDEYKIHCNLPDYCQDCVPTDKFWESFLPGTNNKINRPK